MAIETTSTLTNSVRARYTSDYLNAAMARRLYDQIATPVEGRPMAELIRGSSVYVPFLADMEPGTATISESTDITPQTLADALAQVTPTSRGEALQTSENLMIQAYTNYNAEFYRKIGQNMMESVDILAQEAAISGNWVERATARASLDAGTTTHYLREEDLVALQTAILSNKVPGFTGSTIEQGEVWVAIMPPEVFHDLRLGGNIIAVGQYQDPGIVLNFELGKVGPFRLVVSPWAKIFYGAGAANGTAVNTTTGAAITALDTTFTISASTNLGNGKWLNVLDGVESSTTYYQKNERVKYISDATSVVTVIGPSANGGFRFDHASGVTVNNSDSVYPVVFGGPKSLAKLYAPDVGEFGQIVGPKRQGLADQFYSLAWKFYGGYGRISESWLVRGEYSVSMEA